MKPESGLDIEYPSELIKPEPGTESGDPNSPKSNGSSWMDHCYVPRVRPSEANGFAVYTRNKRLKSRSVDRTSCAAKIEGDSAKSVKVEDSVSLKNEVVVNGGHASSVVEVGANLGFLGGESDGEMMEIEVKEAPIHLVAPRRRRFMRSELVDSEMENGDLGNLTDTVILEADGSMSEELGLLGSTKTKKMEMKMSKKVLIKGRPTTVRELFETGLLEGYPVFYNGGKRVVRSAIISLLSTTSFAVVLLLILLPSNSTSMVLLNTDIRLLFLISVLVVLVLLFFPPFLICYYCFHCFWMSIAMFSFTVFCQFISFLPLLIDLGKSELIS